MEHDVTSPGAAPPSGRSPLRVTTEAERLASAYPPLLLEADRIAHTIAQGLHGRRRPGTGETFWQFRRYGVGDEAARIDWRKSARSDQLFVRENEWEAANTIWLWVNQTRGMAFKSHLSKVTKGERATLLSLALAGLMLTAGERVGILGRDEAPASTRNALRRLADGFFDEAHAERGTLPPQAKLQRYSNVVLMSDFLVPIEDISHRLAEIASYDVKGHLVQVFDPAEETLPYNGRKEFEEIGGVLRFMVGRAEDLRGDYRARILAHRQSLKELARRLGWTFTLHHTDQTPNRALLILYGLMSGDLSRGAVAVNR